MQPEINSLYGNRIRVRACGLCWKDDAILLVNHTGISAGDWWAPPGGGLEFGETVHERLRAEFTEETGLDVSVGSLLFACEFIQKPLHAIELFFDVHVLGGSLKDGQDPELAIIREVKFMSAAEIARVPAASLHGIFTLVRSPDELKTLAGFFTI